MKRCKYCAKQIDYDQLYCCDECSKQGERYFGRWKQYKMMYCCIVLIILILIIMQIIIFPEQMIISKVFIMILGVTLYALPFGNTQDSLGIEKTTHIVRVIAICMIVLAMISIII